MNTSIIQELKLQSIEQSISEIEPFVHFIVTEFNLKEELLGNILISLTEATSNAIFHGNRKDPLKMVHITAEKKEQQLLISVKDEGPGFDPESLSDPTAPENIMLDGGRGVFLIKQLSDKISFSESGNLINIYFNL